MRRYLLTKGLDFFFPVYFLPCGHDTLECGCLPQFFGVLTKSYRHTWIVRLRVPEVEQKTPTGSSPTWPTQNCAFFGESVTPTEA